MSVDGLLSGRRRSKLYALALLAGVFVAGVAVGAAVSAAASDTPRRDRGDGRREGSYADRLARDLELSPVQQESVKAILERYEGPTEAIWADMRPRMDSIRSAIRGEIVGVLDSAQRQEYRMITHRADSARAARDREREARRGH
jgi:hypothetical protein